jgi:hypothetical protein
MKLIKPISTSTRALGATLAAIVSAGPALCLADPISVTGYNHDVIYEAGATGAGNGSFTNESSALYEQGLDPAPNGGNGHGLPSDRTLTDLNGGNFKLAPYTEANALMVGEGNNLGKFATWTFAAEDQVPYSRLSVLGLSAGGQSNFSLVVFFTDGTNTGAGIDIEGRTDIRGEFDGQTMPDWFQNGGNSAGAVDTGLGRVDSNNGNGNGVGINLQQWNYDLSAHAGKSVDHVEFESTGGTGNNRAFLAISGTRAGEAKPFTITNSTFDLAAGTLQLTWVSNPNKTYRITASTDLIDWDTELAAGVHGTSASAATTLTVSIDAATKQFFRVEEE